ncbi:hypothetical protein K2X33_13610 [bacterium]|nr:hypothetical protein [bacterium]
MRRLSRPAALVLAQCLGVALLCTAHHGMGALGNKGAYTPFSVGTSVSAQVFDETHLYAPGARRFADGYGLPAETDVYELRDRQHGYPVMHSLVLGGLARVLGGLERAWIFWQGLGPVLLWLSFFAVLRVFTSLLYASSGAWLVLLCAFGPRHAWLQGADVFYQPLEITRLAHPALSAVFLCVAVFGAIQVCRRAAWLPAFAWGIAAGLLFSAYYFYWVGFFSAALLAGIAALLLRKWRLAGRWVVFGAGSLLSAAPYLYRVLQGGLNPGENFLMARVGDFTHAVVPHSLFMTAVLVGIFLFWIYRHRRSLHAPVWDKHTAVLFWIYALLAGAGLGMSFHFLSGYDAQHTHFLNRLAQPLLALLALIAFWRCWPERLQGKIGRLVLCLAAFLGAAALVRQTAVAIQTHADHRSDSDEQALGKWLEANAQGSVVATTDSQLALLLPALASHWLFVPVADRSLASTPEALLRYVTVSKLEGRTEEEMWERLTKRGPDDSRLWLHTSYVLAQQPHLSPQNQAEAHRLWKETDPEEALKTRRLDYVIVEASQTAESLTKHFPKAKEVYSNAHWRAIAVH